MAIVSSAYTASPAQVDGRFYVNETHTSEDGQIFTFEYLNDGIDPQEIMAARAAILSKKLDDKEAVRAALLGTELPLTVYEFLKRFTAQERIAIRAEAKTDAGVDDFMSLLNQSSFVYTNNEDVLAGLAYLVSKNLLTTERAAEIGAA